MQGDRLTFLGKLAGGVLRGPGWSRDAPLVRGCLSAAALVAAVDGDLSLAKRNRLDQILDELSGVQSFDLHRALEAFQSELDRIRADGRAGRAVVMASVERFAGDQKAVELILRVAQAIAVADGDVSPHGRAMIGEIAGALAVPMPDIPKVDLPMPKGNVRVIVVGNEKGGTGKSTTAIHVATGLAVGGRPVACLALEGRQAPLSRFMENRAAATETAGKRLVIPRYRRIEPSPAEQRTQADHEERERFDEAMAELEGQDAVVVDTPGYSSHLARLAHARANVVITPINDSFIDIDALADIDRERRIVRAPSSYCRMVWEERERRRNEGGSGLDWIVTRNRVGHLDSRNTREMAALLEVLSRRIGFRLQPGFSERVVFRELFFRGLTLFDLAEDSVAHNARNSLRRAKLEVEGFLSAVASPADRSTRAQTD